MLHKTVYCQAREVFPLVMSFENCGQREGIPNNYLGERWLANESLKTPLGSRLPYGQMRRHGSLEYYLKCLKSYEERHLLGMEGVHEQMRRDSCGTLRAEFDSVTSWFVDMVRVRNLEELTGEKSPSTLGVRKGVEKASCRPCPIWVGLELMRLCVAEPDRIDNRMVNMLSISNMFEPDGLVLFSAFLLSASGLHLLIFDMGAEAEWGSILDQKALVVCR